MRRRLRSRGGGGHGHDRHLAKPDEPVLSRVMKQPTTAPMFRDCYAAAVSFYREHGWLLLHTLDPEGLEQVRTWVDEITAWAGGGSDWLPDPRLSRAGAG